MMECITAEWNLLLLFFDSFIYSFFHSFFVCLFEERKCGDFGYGAGEKSQRPVLHLRSSVRLAFHSHSPTAVLTEMALEQRQIATSSATADPIRTWEMIFLESSFDTHNSFVSFTSCKLVNKIARLVQFVWLVIVLFQRQVRRLGFVWWSYGVEIRNDSPIANPRFH